MMKRIALLLSLVSMVTNVQGDEVLLHAAGSLKSALGEVAREFGQSTGLTVKTAFAPSGLLRKRIEGGEAAEVYASANMKHPEALNAAGLAGPVTLFARNTLCAIAQPQLTVTEETLLDVLLDDATRLGTSTPKADPSGDYAWTLFEKAETVRPGAFAILDAKAMKLTGGADTQAAPQGRNQYGWVMEGDKADIFLTYCTNAVLAAREVPGLRTIQIPEALSVGADYGITLINGASDDAARLRDYILGEDGQKVLAAYGFKRPD